jgi:hypothetical protein
VNPTLVNNITDTILASAIQGIILAATRFWFLWLSIIVLAFFSIKYENQPKKLFFIKVAVLAFIFTYSLWTIFIPFFIRAYL